MGLSGVVALGLAYFVADRFWLSKHGTDVHSVAKPADDSASNGGLPAATVATFNPPPHSIAVLPFINMSGDKEQEYFSDGLTEELLNSLAGINGLQVAPARRPSPSRERTRTSGRSRANSTSGRSSREACAVPAGRCASRAARQRCQRFSPVVRDLRPRPGRHVAAADRDRHRGRATR